MLEDASTGGDTTTYFIPRSVVMNSSSAANASDGVSNPLDPPMMSAALPLAPLRMISRRDDDDMSNEKALEINGSRKRIAIAAADCMCDVGEVL